MILLNERAYSRPYSIPANVVPLPEQKSTHFSTVILSSAVFGPLSVRAWNATSVPQPTYSQFLLCVRSVKYDCGLPIVVGAPQPVAGRAPSGLLLTGLQPGSAGSTPVSCSLIEGGILQPLASASVFSGRSGGHRLMSPLAPPLLPLPSRQLWIASVRMDVSHPLT